MSLFKVNLTNITELSNHSNADRLELAKVEGLGYQFCVQKGEYKIGDEVVYFPIDSLFLDDLSLFLGIKKFLAGKDKNRLKTIKLRGEISQGLVVMSDKISSFLSTKNITWPPVDLTESLGIKKYEYPEVSCKAGKLIKLPDGVPFYDIESFDNFPNVFEILKKLKVWVTEKLEGTNFSITVTKTGDIFVNQRGFSIIPVENQEHDFWKAAREFGYIEKIKKIQAHSFPNQQVTLRGELVGPGIQKNIYKIPVREVFFFDVLVDDRYINSDTWFDICTYFELKTVPILEKNIILQDWIGNSTIQKISNGQSAINTEVKREGIVIKPSEEQFNIEIGRLMLKQRSPEYLAENDM